MKGQAIDNRFLNKRSSLQRVGCGLLWVDFCQWRKFFFHYFAIRFEEFSISVLLANWPWKWIYILKVWHLSWFLDLEFCSSSSKIHLGKEIFIVWHYSWKSQTGNFSFKLKIFACLFKRGNFSNKWKQPLLWTSLELFFWDLPEKLLLRTVSYKIVPFTSKILQTQIQRNVHLLWMHGVSKIFQPLISFMDEEASDNYYSTKMWIRKRVLNMMLSNPQKESRDTWLNRFRHSSARNFSSVLEQS